MTGAEVELVRHHGLLAPIPVVRTGPRRWEIVADENRWIAAQRAGLHEVPIIEVEQDLDDTDLGRIAAAEAVIDPIADAQRLRDRLATIRQHRRRGALLALAAERGRSAPWICHRLRLLDLPADVREAIAVGALSAGHGRALVRAPDDDACLRLAVLTIEQSWSVRRLEGAIRSGVVPTDTAAPVVREPARSPDIERLERRLGGIVGCATVIHERAGTLVFDYRRALDVLDGLLVRLCGPHVGAVPGCALTVDEPAGTVTIDYRGSLDVLDDVLSHLGAVDDGSC